MVADTWRCPGCELSTQLREQIPAGEKGLHVHLIPNPELTPKDAPQEDDRG